ncbi:uncharacterized protein LOC129915214 [Episyrphus balteatus]|uniref:uncharacterized protein LOC129915214 n=1 Tax=Episyrphus balteatus TaxID=286459 RepID=UPI002485D6FD|nr:uncharacterized protein LOC129915214 [Episyrphus balteatus]
MSSETIFEYRHKKFDQRKRSREDDSFSSENGTNSSILDLSDSSKASISSTSVISKPIKQRRVVKTFKQVPQTQSPHPFEQSDSELRQRMQLINLHQYIPPNPTVPIVNGILPTTKSFEDRILFKTEIIEPNDSVNYESSLPKQKRRRTQSEQSIKIEPQSTSSDLKIKQELIELNTHLPAIPREAYEDICKFRSNMVRKFPKKERSIKEQERRDKNTYACRKSRRVKKIEQVAVEEEYKNYKNANLRMAEYAIRAAAYFKELTKMTAEAAASEVIVVD